MTVFFSGYPFLDETWEWNGSTWTQAAATGPSGRWGLAMSYDGIRGSTVLFGGADATRVNRETWEYGSPVFPCPLLGDVDGDGTLNSADLAGFVRVMLGTPDPTDIAECADYGTEMLEGDIAVFVTDLLD